MGRFPELLYEATGPLADSTLSRHSFALALKQVDPTVLQAVFPEVSPSLSGWMALAGIVERLHREVGAEGLDFRGVSREFKRGFPYDDSSRWEVLAEVQNSYLEILSASGLRDRDRERRAALEEGRLSSPGEIWMVGWWSSRVWSDGWWRISLVRSEPSSTPPKRSRIGSIPWGASYRRNGSGFTFPSTTTMSR